MTRTLVLGIGDVLHADEGAGVYAMRYLKDHYDLPDTSYHAAGTRIAALEDEIVEAYNLIILDAAEIDADPGTVRVFEDKEVDEFLNSEASNGRELGIADLMHDVRLEGKLPIRYALIGIQPEKLELGDAPSETVRRSMPRAAGNAAALVYKWRRPVPGRVAKQRVNLTPKRQLPG